MIPNIRIICRQKVIICIRGIFTVVHGGLIAPPGIMYPVQRYTCAPAEAELYIY